jgi:kumamolisin
MTENGFAALLGSERAALADFDLVGPVDAGERIAVTLVLRRRGELPNELVEGPETLTREQLADRHGADPADVDAVREALTAAGLDVIETDAGSRRVVAEGLVGAITAAFGTDLNVVRSNDPVSDGRIEHRARTGALAVPAALDGLVVAVLGLDDRPQARMHLHRLDPHASAAAKKSYKPNALGTIYNFPAGTDGSGQTLAIIELGGGFAQSDLDTYFSGLGIAKPSVTAVGVDGGANTPANDPNSADGEVLLDIEVAGALAPKATQLVYFAPNTDRGFVDAVTTAVHATPTPAVVSISWGASEDAWTAQARTAFDQALADAGALGVTVTVASGDNGSPDGQTDGKQHTDFPSSSPHVLACGGTYLDADAASGKVTTETVWNAGTGKGATGGGVSGVFGLPSYQTTAGVPNRVGGTKPGRGVPDVAAVADPASGYEVLVDGQSLVFGGTSAVAPLWAALVCRLVQSLGKPLGLAQTRLYAGVKAGQVQPGFRDITTGDNGAYKAAAGWDACTGLGVPDGEALLTALRG